MSALKLVWSRPETKPKAKRQVSYKTKLVDQFLNRDLIRHPMRSSELDKISRRLTKVNKLLDQDLAEDIENYLFREVDFWDQILERTKKIAQFHERGLRLIK